MALLTFEYLEALMAKHEGLSQRGSEPAAGHADGFEVANNGVTRRAPGEGAANNGGRAQPQEMDSYDQPQYESWSGVRDPDGFENQEHRGVTGPPAQLMSVEEGPMPTMGSVFGQGKTRVVWSPGEYGADIQKLLKVLPPGPLLNRLQGAGQYAMVSLEQEEAESLETALIAYTSKMRRSTPEVELAQDVLQQLDHDRDQASAAELSDPDDRNIVTGAFGEGADPAKLGRMKGAVSAMRNAVDTRLKKSSEKEKKEHPWMSNKQATRVAKDHAKLGEQLKRTFLFREMAQPGDLKPGDGFCAVQFIDLEGQDASDPNVLRNGYKCAPDTMPMKGYVVYVVGDDMKLKFKYASWDSGD